MKTETTPKGKHHRTQSSRTNQRLNNGIRNFYATGSRKIIPKEYQDVPRDVIELDDELDILSRY